MEEILYTNSYIILATFLIIGIGLPIVAVGIGNLLRPHQPTREKGLTYESGIDPYGQSWVRFSVRYYIFALLFVIFDVEAVFLYPWAVAFRELGAFAMIEMGIFIVTLLIGLIYAWKKKVLEWI